MRFAPMSFTLRSSKYLRRNDSSATQWFLVVALAHVALARPAGETSFNIVEKYPSRTLQGPEIENSLIRSRSGLNTNASKPIDGLAWQGCDTITSTIFVTATEDVPDCITLTQVWGESTINGGTITLTEYQGVATVIVERKPSYLTVTVYPTTTTFSTSKVIIPTSTRTKTTSWKPTQTAEYAQESDGPCKPGDAEEREQTGLKPTHDQSITLYVIAIYIVGIALGWNLILIRDLLWPLKSLVVGFHEIGHVIAVMCLGGSIGEFCMSPNPGGLTLIFNPEGGPSLPLPMAALPSGYIVNIMFGGLLTFCGFNTLASKIASFIVGICLVAVLSRAGSFLAKIVTLMTIGLMIGLWWIEHAWALRFFILFIGVMSSFYVLWDVLDDAVFAKRNPCCPAQHTLAYPLLSPGMYTIIWFLISFTLFVGFVLAALATWKQSPHAMYCQARAFLPT
ncbi:hypothetical protein OIO90_001559 [Microbotryomycetes sp. JL221]|nr:hypothetical protein OIO90_001559 [Microbotryomycetes sp. JL221]